MQKFQTSMTGMSTNAIAIFDDDMDYDDILQTFKDWHEAWACGEKTWISELFDFRDKEMPHITNDELVLYAMHNKTLELAKDAMYEG